MCYNRDMKVEQIDINLIKPYAKNTKKHPASQIEHIANSLDQFGFKQPIVIDSNNEIVVGHGRYYAAKQLGYETVPVVMANDLTPEEVKAYRLADNKTNESEWDFDFLKNELDDISTLDMSDFGFLDAAGGGAENDQDNEITDDRDPSCQHNVFENQELMQFPCKGRYGIPEMKATDTTGDKMLRFMDWREVEDPENYIAHFYYDDYKFIAAWREPEKYIERLKRFRAVVSPDFSLYTDFPIALQILSCYRRQWCGAFWQYHGIDVIPDVVWGEKKSYSFCFDGIPKHSTVAVSSVGVKNDDEWNNKTGDLFVAGYNEMLKRLEPTTILFYGDMIDGLEGNIIQIPSYYAEKRAYLNEKAKERKDGQGK